MRHLQIIVTISKSQSFILKSNKVTANISYIYTKHNIIPQNMCTFQCLILYLKSHNTNGFPYRYLHLQSHNCTQILFRSNTRALNSTHTCLQEIILHITELCLTSSKHSIAYAVNKICITMQDIHLKDNPLNISPYTLYNLQTRHYLNICTKTSVFPVFKLLNYLCFATCTKTYVTIKYLDPNGRQKTVCGRNCRRFSTGLGPFSSFEKFYYVFYPVHVILKIFCVVCMALCHLGSRIWIW